MPKVSVGIEKTGGGFWSYVQRSPGELPTSSLARVLRWIVEQLSFGHCIYDSDSSGEVVSLTIGKRAPVQVEDADKMEELTVRRLQAVNLAGLFSAARQKGSERRHAELWTKVSRTVNASVELNTEFHHAFQLLKVLGRVNKKTFQLEAPPILGLASDTVIAYLNEGTLCWLYGLHGASVALSRACLESALRCVLEPGKSSLDDLIREAGHADILDDCMISLAHTVQKTGNKFLHREPVSEIESRAALDAVRSILQHVFAE